MKIGPILPRLCPRDYSRYESLPLFGSLLEEFFQWLRRRGYTLLSLENRLWAVSKLESWLRHRRKRSLADLSTQDLRAAHDRFRGASDLGGLIREIGLFLSERGFIPEGRPPPTSRLERELIDFGGYLRQVRGLADHTIESHQLYVRQFLTFLKFAHDPSVLASVKIHRVEGFLRLAAKTNNRYSLQHVVAALRAYLRRQHALGILPRPLHEQIDTPRVYRLERLPRALPWDDVSELLRSIDCTQPGGRRDFTILYLAVRYGLRSGELVRLRLDDIDWRAGTLRVPQSKTRQTVVLPLTDEAGDVLCRYLREARPSSSHRELFLRRRAPIEPLTPAAVHDALENRVERSGLALERVNPHALRHSFAVHLLHEGASIKAIGDTLGHRDAESTAVYLRLAIDDLRGVGLPLPKLVRAAALLPDWNERLPTIRGPVAAPLTCTGFRSVFAASLREYLATRRALGRLYTHEEAILRRWDDFVRRHYNCERDVAAVTFRHWADDISRLSCTVRRAWMRVTRNFLLYHRRRHPRTTVPDTAFFPKPNAYQAPRLVSTPEMARILATARRLPPSCGNPLRAHTVHLGLTLLFCCGLRRGELLGLRLRDFDPRQRVLHVDKTKFHKSRRVPVHASVAKVIHRYLHRRHRLGLPMAPDSPLIWSGGRPPPHDAYTAHGFTGCWQQLCLSAAVLDARGRPPRLHDLRHSMAVTALHRWYVAGRDPQSKLPYLATYLGHVSPVSTHHYLHLTPAIRKAACRRFHRRFARLFGKEGRAA